MIVYMRFRGAMEMIMLLLCYVCGEFFSGTCLLAQVNLIPIEQDRIYGLDQLCKPRAEYFE